MRATLEKANNVIKTLRDSKELRGTERRIKCDLCEYTSLSNEELETHRRTEHTHKCLICKFTFNSTLFLRQHMRRHAEVIIKCITCEKTFKTNDDLKKHLNEEHVKQAKVNCDNCDYQALDHSFLERHMQL